MNALIEGVREFWCSWTHGGGHILRDPLDRVNWRCAKCGRWADPVPLDAERRITDLSINRKAKEQR